MPYDYNILFKPSLYAHVVSGIFLFFAFVLLFQYGNYKTRDYYNPLILYLLFSIAIGIHGISHFCLEFLYNYNPIV